MSPTRSGMRDHLHHFPRVSGDEPVARLFVALALLFSPRERG